MVGFIASNSVYLVFVGGVRVAHFFHSFFVLYYYDFRVVIFSIKTMFGSSLPPVVCKKREVCVGGGIMSYLRYLCLFAHSWVQQILCCVFVSLGLVYPMLPVSTDCPFLVAPSVFSNVNL